MEQYVLFYLVECDKWVPIKNGYSTTFAWPTLVEEVKKRTGKDIYVKAAKNKFNHLKKKWSSWSYLRYKVTGAGWGHDTGLIMANNSWWELQKGEFDATLPSIHRVPQR